MSSPNKIVLIFIMVPIILLSACVLGPSEQSAPRTYFLNPEISWENPPDTGAKSARAVLLISQPKAQAGFDSARMVYLLRPHELSYYAFNQWADAPARMLQHVMVENLEKTGQWRAVLQAPSPVPANFRLDTDNLVLEQQFFSRPSRIRLALRAQLVDVRQSAILATRYFELFEAAPSDDPYGGVQAANRAVEKLLAEISDWLHTTLKAID